MKRTHFFHGILLIVLILSFMACKDDHGPIYLVSATDHQQITDGKLEISPFSKGEKFLIRGGDGNYTIKNEKKEVVDYRYDGDTLTFIPVSIGETSTLIADRSGNSYTLTIVVNNPQNNYRVESISAEAEGDNLTKGEEEELLARIAEDAPVQSGGRLLFTYSDASLTLGDLKIFPNHTGNYQVGIFKRSLKYTEDTGQLYQQFQVEMAGSTTNYTFMLFGNETSSTQTTDNTSSTNEEGAATTNCFIKEEVTAQYKGEFSGLTKAYRIYHLTKLP